MKVTDYIAEKLYDMGIKQVFMVTGGGAMHLNDSIAHHPELNVLFCHHEQACAIAAEGYQRRTGKMACVNVTTGPGGLNALTGVLGQWTDSIPTIYISGQVKFSTTIGSCPDISLRQIGDQEVDIISIVSPIVKYAKSVVDPQEIRYELEKAMTIAQSGRPGPVWLDIPMNVQGAPVDIDSLPHFEGEAGFVPQVSESDIDLLWEKFREAKRPLLIAGHGIRISDSFSLFHKFMTELEIPVATTFNGFDLLPEDSPYFIGRIGTLGSRAGNFALQNSDLVIILGSRNNIRQASYNWENFASNAYIVAVDIDKAELQKPTVQPDLAIHSDLHIFLERFLQREDKVDKDFSQWLRWCQERRKKYPIVTPEYEIDETGISPYIMFKMMTEQITEGMTSVAGNGTACVSLFQAGIVNLGTRYFWNSGCASMGYDLPAAIGAAVGGDRAPVFCFAGDGSLQMNIQELQTVVSKNLPVKIIYLNNKGYSSIKQTQDGFFKRRSGCDEASGVGFPDISRVSEAYGIPYKGIKKVEELKNIIEFLVSKDGPVVCEVFLQTDYIFQPKLSSEKLSDGTIVSKPLEDLFPFLPRDEFENNIIKD